MAALPKPEKPLKILTIDGGGLRGISSLLILDKLLKQIAQSNNVQDSKPRPCDVFDVIAGIGPGGWLALLLGRFQMDVTTALAEWYNLIECITPRSSAEELNMRLRKHSYFHTDRLLEQIEQLSDFYETEKHMFFTPSDRTRCKHVFVAALKTNSKGKSDGYNLFRTYEWPKGANVLPMPSNPREYRISHAFGVTGAAKYFTQPWKERSAKNVKSKFLDPFPRAYNITGLALNEMWGLYGKDVDISVVVNIGPGIPNASDMRAIARRFSWGRKAPKRSDQQFPPLVCPSDQETAVLRQDSFGSNHTVDIEEKLKRDETKIEDDIRRKLQTVYRGKPGGPPPYYRLAPEISAPRTAHNDTHSPKTTFDAIARYLNLSHVDREMSEIGGLIPLGTPLLC
ncbi:MAG: hypothetical protein Q9179_000728 [Wetmoreana sp. 5 TL-2023]